MNDTSEKNGSEKPRKGIMAKFRDALTYEVESTGNKDPESREGQNAEIEVESANTVQADVPRTTVVARSTEEMVDPKMIDQIYKDIETEDSPYKLFKDLLADFRKIIPGLVTCYQAALTALGKTHQISANVIIESIDAMIKNLKTAEKKFERSIKDEDDIIYQLQQQLTAGEQESVQLKTRIREIDVQNRKLQEKILAKKEQCQKIQGKFSKAIEAVRKDLEDQKVTIQKNIHGGE